MPAPLVGGRILSTIAAPTGWSAWFRDEDKNLHSQPVVCWATVESEDSDDKGRILKRTQSVVPIVCTGSAGLIDATIADEVLEYIGVTGPGESTERLLKLLQIDDAEDVEEGPLDSKPRPSLGVVPPPEVAE